MTIEPTAADLLHVEQVSKSYGRARVLTDVDLTVRSGEVHALLGGNGSGKSTLIKALAGVESFDTGGRITVPEKTVPAGRWTTHDARKSNLRFVHQDLGLFAALSVVDNLSLGSGYPRSRWGRVRWDLAHEQARILLQRYGISTHPTARAGELSLAEGAMLAIARALKDVGDGERAVVVLDEPTLALPAEEAEMLHASLRRLVAHGHAVVLVTHDIEEVLTRCDRVTVLRDGRGIHTGETSALRRTDLIELIVGRPAAQTESRPVRGASSSLPALEIVRMKGDRLDISGLVVESGEIVGIAGLLGSGVGEVLRATFGVNPPPQCVLRVGGQAYHPRHPRAAMKQGVAYLPSDRFQHGVFSGLSVSENVTAASTKKAVSAGRIRRRSERREVQRLVEEYQVRPASPQRPIGSLSGGNQQKVLIARWARRRPKLMLLDDPTRGVDVGAREEIWTLLSKSAESNGLGILVSSSDSEELAANCDRVIVLGQGRLFCELAAPDISATRIAEAVYAAAVGGDLR